MTLGERIKETRTALGLTQEALAENLGLAPQTISKWEREESMPDAALLPDLADALGLSLDKLFDRRGGSRADAEGALVRWLKPADEKARMAGVQEAMGILYNILIDRYDEEGNYIPDPYGDGDPRYPKEWDYTLLGDEGLAVWRVNPDLPLGLFIGEGRGWLPLFEDPDELAYLWEALADRDTRRAILRGMRQENLPFDRAEAGEVLGTAEPEKVVAHLMKLKIFFPEKAMVDEQELDVLRYRWNFQLLALLLLARALFGPVTSRAGMTAMGEHRWDTPPLRRREE